jgi:hypothetical protein
MWFYSMAETFRRKRNEVKRKLASHTLMINCRMPKAGAAFLVTLIHPVQDRKQFPQPHGWRSISASTAERGRLCAYVCRGKWKDLECAELWTNYEVVTSTRLHRPHVGLDSTAESFKTAPPDAGLKMTAAM